MEGYDRKPGEDMEFHYCVVDSDYFRTLRIPLVLGRAFVPQDGPGAPGVVVVNETFAARFWPGRNPIGKRLSVSGPQGTMIEVVGVAKDAKYNTLGENPTPFFYLPVLQNYQPTLTLMVRTAADSKSLLQPVREEIR